jgi:hypothetical protein
MLGKGGRVGYLFGDSTESGLDFNYLAFLREAVDCAVAMVECDVTLASVAEQKRAREREMDGELAAVAALAQRAADLVSPVAKEQTATAVGRCAAAIATAIREAAERESTAVRAKLAAQREELDKDGSGVNARATEAVGKLLRTHDLPDAEKELAVTWTSTGVKATMRQRTSFGVEALLALEIPPGSLFTPDLRVERVADNIEVHARAESGWIKKSGLVTHKLGRYHVTSVTIGATVRIQLRADANAGEMTIISPPNGDLMIDASGGGATREIMIEERDRAGLRSFVDKLEAATRALAQSRAQLVSIEIDNKSLGEPGNPRLFAERLTAAMAPTVHKIKQHSRNPDELVLRRLLGDNRREETFVPIAELVQRFEVLPAQGRSVFAALQLQGESPVPLHIEAKRPREPSKAPAHEPARDAAKTAANEPVVAAPLTPELQSILAKPSDTKPIETKPLETKPVVPMPERAGNRTSPPLMAIPEPTPRKKEPTQPFGTPAPSAQDFDEEEWPAISRDQPNDKPS